MTSLTREVLQRARVVITKDRFDVLALDAQQVQATVIERDLLLRAAELALTWIHDPDENATARFDRIADWFHRDTGYTRPGRSTPAALGAGPHPDEVLAAWDQWCAERSRAARAALSVAVAKARGRE